MDLYIQIQYLPMSAEWVGKGQDFGIESILISICGVFVVSVA